MRIKVNSNAIIIICFLLAMKLMSCQSHEQSSSEAFEIVKKEKMTPKKADTAKKIDIVKKNEIHDEWTLYKMNIENIVRMNELRIKEIKSTPNTNIKFLKQVTQIEKDNNDLKAQLYEYYEDGKVRWTKFTARMNSDIEDINKALKDLSVKK